MPKEKNKAVSVRTTSSRWHALKGTKIVACNMEVQSSPAHPNSTSYSKCHCVNLYQQFFQISDAERVLLKAVLLDETSDFEKTARAARWNADFGATQLKNGVEVGSCYGRI